MLRSFAISFTVFPFANRLATSISLVVNMFIEWGSAITLSVSSFFYGNAIMPQARLIDEFQGDLECWPNVF